MINLFSAMNIHYEFVQCRCGGSYCHATSLEQHDEGVTKTEDRMKFTLLSNTAVDTEFKLYNEPRAKLYLHF